VLERPRNHAKDLRTYRFDYLDQVWVKNPKMRQIIVIATNPSGRSVEVSIVTDDLKRPANQVIHLMFNRWTQENDFKYLDQHFGINQIISYASEKYAELKNQVEAKQIKSGAYKALEQQRAELKRTLGRSLLSKHFAKHSSKHRTEKIATLTASLKEVETQLTTTAKEVSRLELLVEQQMVRLETSNKRLIDSLKIIARNAFYQTFQPFKKAYNNYRDDHKLFRNLSQADGVLVSSDQKVDAYLQPTFNYPPKLAKIINELLVQINATQPIMPDGSGRKLRLHLNEEAGVNFAIVLNPTDQKVA
jgi:hypothetical protein